MHSSGAFTISAEKAQEKLSRYSLVHPALYVLQLVSVAVRGKATSFTADNLGSDCHFKFDGEKLSGQELNSVLGQLFETFTSQRLRDLAIALTAGRSTTDRNLVLIISDGAYEFDGERFHQTSDRGDPEFTHIRVPGKFKLFGRLLKREDSLKETLSLCSYAPLDFDVNGRRLSNSFYPDQSYRTMATLEWTHPSYPFKSGMSYLRSRSVQECPHDFSAALFLTSDDAASETGLRIVLAGVPYKTEQSHFQNPGICAVVFTNSLQTDLSCSAIVQNEAFREVVWLLNQKAEDFLRESFRGPDRFSSRLRQAEPSVQTEFERLKNEGKPHSDYQRWLNALAIFQEDPTPTGMETAAQRAPSEEAAEDHRLLAVESIVDQFKAGVRDRNLNHLMTYLPQLDRLLSDLPATPRTEDICQFLDLADPSTEKARADTPVVRLARSRYQGNLSEALELFTTLGYTAQLNEANPQADMLLAQGDYGQALTVLLTRVLADDLEQALAQEFDYYRLEMDLIADCLEYQSNPKSLAFRRRAYESTNSEDLKYLRCIDLARQARKSSDLASWIQYQARIGFHWMGEARTFWDRLHRKVPGARKILECKRPLPEDLDSFLLPLKDAFSHYAKLYPYLLSRLAHQLRLNDQSKQAERVLSRAFTIGEMDRSLQKL